MKSLRWVLLGVLGLAPSVTAEEAAEESDLQPWTKVGKDTELSAGFWNYHQEPKKKTKFYVEIPTAQLGKPFLMATSLSGGTTMAGWQWQDWLLVWERNDKRLVLLERNVGYSPKNAGTLEEAVKRTYTDRVLATFPILANGPKGGLVVDGRTLFAQNAQLFFGGVGRSKDPSLAKFDGSKNFSDNTEISVTLPSQDDGTLITLHYSISRLPNTQYKPRKADDRVGYFMTVIKDFSAANKDERRNLRYINRWNLEKADPSLALSPPKEPIRFYIEKTVPVRLRRYVREGILEWNKAYEKIGFDSALVVEQQTDTDHAEKDPEDVRFNFFRWIVSDTPFAMGPSRVNPETGQILDADIIFDDSYVRYTLQEYRILIREVPTAMLGSQDRKVLELLPLKRLGLVPARDEFADAIPKDAPRPLADPHSRRAFCGIGNGVRHQLACAGLCFSVGDEPAAPEGGGEGGAKKPEDFPEELIGQFVKDTVMHEVGHTLGLRHNFKASIFRSYDDINSEAKPGDITGSVMDYNPLIVAPEGRPQGNFAMRTLGPYDIWAIEYGYVPEDKDLPKVVARVAEKGLDYATDEDTWSYDPFVNRWDMGSDPLSYAKERVALMKRLRKNLEERAVDKGEGYQRLRRAVDMQFWEALFAGSLAVRFVGGEHIHRDHRGDPNARPPLLPVNPERQREALRFVCDELLSGRYFDFPPELLGKAAPDYWGEDLWGLLFDGHVYPYLDNVLSVQYSVMY
ncbi:MAG: zinc-dependent metalloprotease, partial [Planctomycetota bacterium]